MPATPDSPESLPPDWKLQIEQLIPAALRLANRICGDADLAEDAVQEALVRIAKNAVQFRGESRISTWALRIVLRACYDLIKARSLAKSRNVDLDIAGESATPLECDPAKIAEFRELQSLIRNVVDELPSRQRDVFVLSIWEQRSVAEISELLDISAQNIYATLAVARTRIRQCLEAYRSGAENRK